MLSKQDRSSSDKRGNCIVRLMGRLVAERTPRIFAVCSEGRDCADSADRADGCVLRDLIRSTSCGRLAKLSMERYEGFVNAKFLEEQRREMVAAIRAMAEHIAHEIGKTALDERVLGAMAKVLRHEFVPIEVQSYAYLNRPIPIGFDKTISQPMTVAVMTDLLELKPDDVVLEIGTGLGYQAAVLAELASRVYSVEIIDELAQRAIRRLKQQG